MPDIEKASEKTANASYGAVAYLESLQASGVPIVISINSAIELAVQDSATYQSLLELVDRIEAIEGIKRGLADAKAGRTCTLDDLRTGSNNRTLPG